MQTDSTPHILNYLSTIPRSGTWFLRYAVSFVCHMHRGGWVRDRVTGERFGDPKGPDFDFKSFNGGPLFYSAEVFSPKFLFMGHTVCPGFSRIAGKAAWWRETAFHLPGYDYFRQGFDYRFTPVNLGPEIHTNLREEDIEEAPWQDARIRIALVYRNPLDQAASYYHYCINHSNASYSVLRDRPLADMPFADYLFDYALPSYAKQFLSFQEMAGHLPQSVRLFRYEDTVGGEGAHVLPLLEHLGLLPSVRRTMVCEAAHLARSEHLKRIEKEIGHSLDSFQSKGGTHMRHGASWTSLFDAAMQSQAQACLHGLGVDTSFIAWPLG